MYIFELRKAGQIGGIDTSVEIIVNSTYIIELRKIEQIGEAK